MKVPPGLAAVPRDFYVGDSRTIAPRLLNKVLVHGGCTGRIVEVEAYAAAEDAGSHAYRGETPRNRTMFGRPGLLYVYFTYGMHWCANAVCGEEGWASAVLLRAVEPIDGIETMRRRRVAARRDRDLTNGPAKLCQAFGIDRDLDGADLVDGDRGIVIADDGMPPPRRPGQSTRIGLSAGAEHPWRWYVADNAYLSRPAGPSGRRSA